LKLLFDQNLSHRLADRLADLFPGSTQVRLIGLDRAPDAEVWEHAAREGFAIATRDVDLAEIATLRGAPPLVLWLRGGNSSTAAVEAALRARHTDILVAAKDGAAVIEVWW
jgi:predicted nuclease of predicted toxin-antitoxin system